MDITQKQIEFWKTVSSESQVLEFKEAKQTFQTDKLKEYCVAIANEGGGHIVLGMSDRVPRRVVGTQACANPIGLADELFNSLGFRVDIAEILHPDGRIVVFKVPSRLRGSA